MKLQQSGSDAEHANGRCYTKTHDSIKYRLALYDDKSIFFSKKGELNDDDVISSVDLCCGGTYREQGKSVHLCLYGLQGEGSKLDILTGEMTDTQIQEEADKIIITEAELQMWTFGSWTAGENVENDSDSD